MTTQDFVRLSTFIGRQYGINFTQAKKSILEYRLARRVDLLNFSSFHEYLNYALDKMQEKGELIELINQITTNKTDFFRESAHFSYLTDFVIPSFRSLNGNTKFKIWSAGCSSGEEPYTIAMIMQEYLASTSSSLPYEIIGTDLSTKVLNQANTGIYDLSRIVHLPMDIKRKYFLKGKMNNSSIVKVKSILRQQVRFRKLNFMDADYQMKELFDVIFFRNVMIYFPRDIQEKVLLKLCKNLRMGGYLFLGHSESIFEMNVPLKQIRPTIFQRI